ncbi:MAG: PAS domain S-box protein [Geobacter sp.]|nr:MAG: PAS domain S-box protein [Geobacter sp.]
MDACITLFAIAICVTLAIVCAILVHRLKNKYSEITKLENELLSQTEQKNLYEKRLGAVKIYEDILINSIPGIFCVTDEFGKVIKFNRRYDEITKSVAGNTTNYNIFNILPEKSQYLINQKIKDAFQSKCHFNVESLVVGSSDQQIHYLFTVSPFVFEDKKYLVVIGFDILLDKQAESERSQSEERLRLAAESTGLGTWYWDLVTGEFYWSDRGSAILGQEPDALKDYYSSFSCVHPDDKERVNLAVMAALDTVKQLEYNTEFRVIWPDNSVHWVSACGKGYFEEIDGKLRAMRMHGICLDITQRKIIDEAFRKSVQKHWSLFAVEPDALILFDKQTLRILEANNSALELYGYDHIDFLSFDIFSICVCKDRLNVLFQKLESDTRCMVESLHKKRDGRIIPVEVSGCKFELNEREVVYLSIRDIADRKAMERELVEARKDLEKKVQLRTYELTAANTELQAEIVKHKMVKKELEINENKLLALSAELSMAEDKERRRIASELHDDIGQNLAISYIKLDSLLLSSIPHPCTAAVEEIKGFIAYSIQKVRSLTSQLSPPLLYQIGFTAVIRWLGETYRNDYGSCVEILGDVVRKELGEEIALTLFQIIRELLINITKHAAAKNSSILIAKEKDKIIITIVDDGIGFDISNIGTNDGFGLFNIQQRIKYLGGQIFFDSTIGKGTKITISAPLFLVEKE